MLHAPISDSYYTVLRFYQHLYHKHHIRLVAQGCQPSWKGYKFLPVPLCWMWVWCTWPPSSIMHYLRISPLIITSVLFIFSFIPLPSSQSFYWLSFLISSLLSAITTKSSTYSNSHGKASLNFMDIASVTVAEQWVSCWALMHAVTSGQSNSTKGYIATAHGR